MKKNSLLIGIPTKGHARYLQYYFSILLPEAKCRNIDVGIYDSSEDDDTLNLVNRLKEKGYDNLIYKRYPQDVLYWKKLKDIFVDSGYDYVWLCGDGRVICLDKCADMLEEEFEKKRDLIVLCDDGMAQDMETADARILAKNCCIEMGCYGRFLVRGDWFGRAEWERYEKKYRDWLHVGACLEKFAGGGAK